MSSSSSGYAYGDDFELIPYVVPNTEYNIYFGGLHDHTGVSDGQGTPDQAFQYASAYGDFMGLSDHNTSIIISEWDNLKGAANRNSIYNDFIGLAGYEMTTNSWGHANVFNSDSYMQFGKTLSDFYGTLVGDPNSIGQFNHPGWADMNLFENFGGLTPEIDNVMELLEVGNGYGQMDRSDNYGWYYGTYITALDKGWHIAPVNNQDNHKATWLQEMPTRTAILAHTLDRANIIDAVKNKRVYATEDENLKMYYRVNESIMGSILNSPSTLNFNINIENPEVDVPVKEIRIVADGGRIVDTKICTSNVENWNFTIPAQYSYYFLYVILENDRVAVTAPVWTGLQFVPRSEVSQITLSTIPETSNERFVVNLSNLRPPHTRDWIGLYEESETPDGNPRSIWYSFLQDLRIDDSGNGSFIFDPNEIPDLERLRYQANRTYKFIYAYDNSYGIVASSTFTINPSAISSGTNLALNKTATASSYWDNNNDPNYAPVKAVDGSAATNWNAARDTSGGQWIEIDFGTPTTFNKVVTKANLDRITGYKLQYWNGSEYIDIMNGSRVFPIAEDVFDVVTAQKIRFFVLSTKTDQNNWGVSPRIDELEVYYEPNAQKSIQNFALNKTAVASSNWNNDAARPAKAFDGRIDSTWNAARDTAAGQWLEVDLGKPETFNTITLNATLKRISGYKLQYLDGTSWIDIYEGGLIKDNKYIRFNSITAQKVRLYVLASQVDQNGWGSDPEINEMAVYMQ